LFCVHGQPLKIAQRINPDRPIYGLSHVYHSDFLDETPESIEKLAAQYLSEIRMVQAHGPYHFCGFSAGGLIAFELARQLLADGEKIDTLLLVEPTIMNRALSWGSKIADTVAASDGLLSGITQLLSRAPESIKSRVRFYSKVLHAKCYFVLGRPLPERLRWLGYLKSLRPAMLKYEYEPIDCKGILLYQKMGDEYCESARLFWNNLLLQGATVKILQDARRHEDFMQEPALTQTVELIDR